MQKHYPFWEFQPESMARWDTETKTAEGKKPYTIIMPPPNVTGYLHLGHAFSSTLQDILIRFKRLKGYDVLWLPGTDHAGIATQMMVEKHLAKEGLTRIQLGREAFLQHVWTWKEKYGGLIIDQMKSMGFSAHWSHLSFTLDPNISQSVVTAFVELHQKGLAYRAERLINWDPVLQTAVSDLEVVQQERTDPFWTVRYAIEGDGHIDIATTRPETLFGDMAIAVHPQDPRFTSLIGKTALVPLINRPIPIIADEAVIPEKGTGAVKVTPAHDFLDFDIGKRHNLQALCIFDDMVCLNDRVPAPFQGLGRDEARLKVVQALGEACLHQEMLTHSVPHSDRSQAILEPRLKKQWFIDMKEMAEKGLDAVASGKLSFFPPEWVSHYERWLENIQPWCVSRQLWWGHQIPAWYGPEGSLFVAASEEEAYAKARKAFGIDVVLVRDEDVLDTWFSSGLWPFSTLGWPQNTQDMQRHYPGDVLITGFDILFFWVARMVMLGTQLTGQVPFHHVYLHPLIRDEKGQKMSKTKGNVINPLDVAKDYGADALRFALAWIAAPAQHVSFSMKHVETSRNFITKIWNMSRFLQMHDLVKPDLEDITPTWVVNVWIRHKTMLLVEGVTKALEEYRFHEAAFMVYDHTWKLFCDWYVELVKDMLRHDARYKAEIQATTTYALRCLLMVLHPFIPFVTEKLWSMFGFEGILMHANWPVTQKGSCEEGDFLIDVMTQIRKMRSELRIPTTPLCVTLEKASPQQQQTIEANAKQLERLMHITLTTDPVEEKEISARLIIEGAHFVIPIAHAIDVDKECVRLRKDLLQTKQAIDSLIERLSNTAFLEKAPKDVIETLQQRLVEEKAKQDHDQRTLEMFTGKVS